MKFKIEVEVDYISDEGSIDEMVMEKIANSIVEKMSDKSINSLSSKAEKLINDRATELVDDVFKGIMNNPIDITDNWGQVIKSYGNTEEMIKARFDSFLLERVDSNGNSTSYGSTTRIDLIIKNQIDKTAKEFTKNAIDEVSKRIKETLSEDLKMKLGDKLLNVIEIDKLITKKISA